LLFLLRPRQTWMPYALPRDPDQQRLHSEELHRAYQSTRRVAPSTPAADGAPGDPVARLQELALLHQSGSLTDAEFAQAKELVFASSGRVAGAGSAGATAP
jgi:hypothetical protein